MTEAGGQARAFELPARAVWLGRRAYGVVHRLQQALVEARASGEVPDTLLLLEHEPVVTLGRRIELAHVRVSNEEFERLGVALVETGRDLAKIGAVGVRLSRWVTMHGFAINGSTDLAQFQGLVVPCGIQDRGVTSIEDLTGHSPGIRDLARRSLAHFHEVFGLETGHLLDLSEATDAALPDLLGVTLLPASPG
jgi:lipoate-protein ligase B